MSTGILNESFQEFLHTIYYWPSPTIEKSALIPILEELCHKNPELQNIYNDVSMRTPAHQFSDDNDANYSRLASQKMNADQSDDEYLNQDSNHNNNHQLITNGNHVAKKESNRLSNTTLVKGGDLTIRKGSTILSPLLKKKLLKKIVHCELLYKSCDKEKLIYLIVYQSRKNRKILHQFILDDTCSFAYQNKREFQFKHALGIENFTTETGIADTWISSFNEFRVLQNTDMPVEDVYEPISEPLSLENICNTPVRPPPRPPQPTNSILPENIYVCLYDHSSTTEDSNELKFNRGDLLYIINTDGPNFYVGHPFILPFNTNGFRNPIGLVFKDYIIPAYEKVC